MTVLLFGLKATERLLPKLALNLTTAAFDNHITFTRTTGASNPATHVNSSGVINAATNNQPRFDYDPVTLACKGLLVEESRANACTYSSTFSSWTGGVATVNSDATTAPDGTTTADELVRVSTQDDAKYTVVTFTGDGTKSVSVFVKYLTASFLRLLVYETTTAATRADLRITFTGGVPAVTSAPAGSLEAIEAFPNGWYRIKFLATNVVAANTNRFYIYPAYAGAANGEKTACWGAQAENGPFATSYIPTTSTALTRNADVAAITGTAFSGFWRSGPCSLLVRALPSTVSGTRPLVQVDDATADNIIALRGNTTNPELYIRAGGADQATIDAGTISAAAYRLAGAWQAGSAAASLNSGLAVNGAPGSIPAPTQMRLGSDGTNYLNGHLQAVEYWPLRLSNAGLQTASSTAGYQSIIHPVSRDTII